MSSKMSHDRVLFTVSDTMLRNANIRKALNMACNIDENLMRSKGNHYQNMVIKCRPSQFARFIIVRQNIFGEPNNMAGLNMKLIPGEQREDIMDVSEKPNKIWEHLQ